MTVRLLAIADEPSEALWDGDALKDLHPDLIVACGDLPFDYLENLVSRSDKPLLFVPGNHDPDLSLRVVALPHELDSVGPAGCDNIDGRIVEAAGLRIAGLGGSLRYRPGPNQYTQRQMALRAFRLAALARLTRKRVDVLVTHAPPAGYGDSDDPPHQGFTALVGLVNRLAPRLMLHGHVNTFGPYRRDGFLGRTKIVNVIPFRLLEV